jgi:hypothetical protein
MRFDLSVAGPIREAHNRVREDFQLQKKGYWRHLLRKRGHL